MLYSHSFTLLTILTLPDKLCMLLSSHVFIDRTEKKNSEWHFLISLTLSILSSLSHPLLTHWLFLKAILVTLIIEHLLCSVHLLIKSFSPSKRFTRPKKQSNLWNCFVMAKKRSFFSLIDGAIVCYVFRLLLECQYKL